MKNQLKIAVTAGAANSLLVCGGYGLFMATVPADALWRMIGIAPGSPLAGWQVALGCVLWIFSGPLYWLSDPKSTVAFLCVSMVSSFLWGMCLVLLIYAIRQRLRKDGA
jgi:hypothetical protein